MAVYSSTTEPGAEIILKDTLSTKGKDVFRQAFQSIVGNLQAEQDKVKRDAMISAIHAFYTAVIFEFQPNIVEIPLFYSLGTFERSPPEKTPSQQLLHEQSINSASGDDLKVVGDTSNASSKRSAIRKSQRTPRKAQRLLESSQELFPVKLALNSETSVGDLEVARNTFFHEISQINVSIRTDNKVISSTFDRPEAMAITNFFFAEVMGSSARQRLASLIAYYQSHEEESMDVGIGSRAEQLSQSDFIPASIRRFYKSFSQAYQRKVNSQTHYASFMRMVANVELYHEWVRLRDLAADKDATLISTLSQAGLEPRRGVDYRSLVNQYLTSELGLNSTVALQNTCQAAQGLAGLVKEFGNGVLVLLPPETANRLNRWGNQRMAVVYPILNRCVQAFTPICRLAETELYTPIIQGAKLQTSGSIARNASLEQLLNISRRVEEIVNSDVDMMDTHNEKG